MDIQMKNVYYFYIDPKTGERKSQYIGDGSYEEVQAKTEAFKRSIEEGKADDNTDI